MNNDLKIFYVLMSLILVADLLYFIHSPSYIIAWAIGWICGLTATRHLTYIVFERGVNKK